MNQTNETTPGKQPQYMENPPPKPTKAELVKRMRAVNGQYCEARDKLIATLASRPCSELGYLYGQCLQAEALRDIEETRKLLDSGKDVNLDTQYNLAGKAYELLEQVLVSHPESGDILDLYNELDSVRTAVWKAEKANQ